MCGINGFNWNDSTKINLMNKITKHRGPDDEGIFIRNGISLGHVRLSIIDLSDAGHQPMSNENDTIWITYNGEIYNFCELKEHLLEKGHVFKSKTDTEMIIHAYEEYGFDCVNKFNGMWSFCIYDETKNILFLSRDRFGIKPLYYCFNDKAFIFSSEIKGILAHDIEIKPDKEIVFDFLYYNMSDHTENTFFKNIKRLMPSSNLVFNLKTKEIQLHKYYDLEQKIRNERYNSREIKDLFYDSVKNTLVSDVPVGSCLSGGIDSSSIVLAMNNTNGIKIKTFSMVFPGKKIDESKYQKEINGLINSDPYSISPGPDELIKDIYDLISTQEEPFAGTSVYGQYKVMKLAKDNDMKVLLDGQGADEIFAGYHYFLGFYYYELLKNLRILKFIKEIRGYYTKTGSILPLSYLFMRILPVSLKKLFFNRYKNTFISRSFIKDYEYRKDVRWYISSLNDALTQSILNYSLPHLLRFEDKNSMRFSIESRVPFLDYRLVEYALSIPTNYKVHDGITKYSFRKAIEKLPASIRCRFDKIGFSTPEDNWLRNERVKEYVLSIIDSESFKNREFWDFSKVKNMYERILTGKHSKLFVGTDIWRCICVELWMRIFIDTKSG